MNERTGYAVSAADGLPIYYTVSEPVRAPQDEPVPTVALCDGIGCDGYVWKYLRRELEATTRIVHWHYRGHGRTRAPDDLTRISIADCADDLACVLDDAGVDRAVLMGHSMGVQVVLETYRRHGERVDGMILACGAPANPLRTFRGKDTLERLLPAVRKLVARTPGLSRGMVRHLLPTRLSYKLATLLEVNGVLIEEADFAPYLRGMSRIDPALFLGMLAEAGSHSALDLLSSIAAPTLIIAGSRDGFTPPDLSLEMHEQIPEAELLVVHEGSHTAPLERPDYVNRAIVAFLRRRVYASRKIGSKKPTAVG